jgi:hypothetical protein
MSLSDEPRTPTHYSNAPSVYPSLFLGTAVALPFPEAVLPENLYDDLTMMDRPDAIEGFVDTLDRLHFETRESENNHRSVPTEEPYNEETGLLHVKRLLKEREEEMRREWKETQSEASKSCGRGQAEDYRKSLATRQSRSWYRPFHPPSQGGRASHKSGVSKSHRSSTFRQPTVTQTAKSTCGGGGGAKHNAGGGARVGWSRSGVEEGAATVDNHPNSAKWTESTVNQIRHGPQGMGLGEEGEMSSVNDIGQGMQEMSIDRK